VHECNVENVTLTNKRNKDICMFNKKNFVSVYTHRFKSNANITPLASEAKLTFKTPPKPTYAQILIKQKQKSNISDFNNYRCQNKETGTHSPRNYGIIGLQPKMHAKESLPPLSCTYQNKVSYLTPHIMRSTCTPNNNSTPYKNISNTDKTKNTSTSNISTSNAETPYKNISKPNTNRNKRTQTRNGIPNNNIGTTNNIRTPSYNGTTNNIATLSKNGKPKENAGPTNNKDIPDIKGTTNLRHLLHRSGDIETNPGPDKSKIKSKEKYTKKNKASPNKNKLLLRLATLLQILGLLKSITQITIKTETLTPGNNSKEIKTGTINIVTYRVSMIYNQYKFCYWHKKKTKNNHKNHMTLLILLLLLGGDIEINPGPKSTYPCGICERDVNDSQRAFCCDGCDIWYHKTCISMCTEDFEYLENRSISYICYKCNVPNHISNLHQSYEVETFNQFEHLSNISMDLTSPNNNTNRKFIPKYHSSPKGIPKARMPIKITITESTQQNEFLSDTENENNTTLEGNPPESNEIPELANNSGKRKQHKKQMSRARNTHT
jgi:hypothetical protein